MTPSVRFWLCAVCLLAACGGGSADDGAPTEQGQTGASGGPGGGGAAPLAGAPPSAPSGRAGHSVGGGAANGGATNGGAINGGATNGGATNGGATNGGAGQPAGAGPTSAGSSGTEPFGPSPACKPWPKASGTQEVSQTRSVKGSFDGELQRFVSDGLGTGEQGEEQQPLFELADGATLTNVIIGAPAADGIHCLGSCTLTNVWWEDVGEDAATLKGSSSSQKMTIDCGGAKQASDKVFQHNGPGTFEIRNFYVESFGKLYRSCGNCSKQYERHALFSGIRAEDGKSLAGVNENYGDTATFSNIVTASSTVICQRYTGNDSGDEPQATGTGADGDSCIYQPSDIHKL